MRTRKEIRKDRKKPIRRKKGSHQAVPKKSKTAGSVKSIESLLTSTNVKDVLRGLGLVEENLASSNEADKKAVFEMIASLFYIDVLEQPHFVPVLEEAVSIGTRFGDVAIPILLEKLDAGDLKAQIAAAHALGKMGANAIQPLITAFQSTNDPERRSFVLYALGKIKSPEVEQVLGLALEAARSDETELRDTAVRALGKFAEVIHAHQLSGEVVKSLTNCLTACFADPNPGIRAKAVRSMGKLAKFGHLNSEEKSRFARTCNLFLGTDDKFEWDRAFIVRKEAQEALKYCKVAEQNE